MSKIRILVGLLAVIGSMAVFAGASPAGASEGVGNCIVTAINPAPVVLSSGGYKLSAGRASVYCGVTRIVTAEVQLWGDDGRVDQLVTSRYVTFTVNARTRAIPSTSFVRCNEDTVGPDELYSRSRIRVTSGGVTSAWTPYTDGTVYTFSC